MKEGLAFQADKALLDTVFDGVVAIDLKTLKISLANRAAATTLGFDSPDEMIGLDPLTYIPREDRDNLSNMLTSLASGGQLQFGVEVRVFDKRGKEIWIVARGVRMASNGSSVLLASFRDVTAQKMAETALREAERRQLEMLDISSEMILVSQDWKVVFANRRLLDAMGLAREALTGVSILDMVHPDDRQSVAERYGKIMKGELVPCDKAFKGIGKDGEPRWGVMREVPFSWQGKPAVMTLIQDVTEQRTTEEALRDGEQRYRYLLENANEAVLIIQDWKVAYVNRKFEEGIGVPRESLAGLNILDLAHPDDRQAVSKRYQRIMEGEKYSSGAPIRGLDKDGKTRWGDVREIPFMWEGKPAVMSMMVDITERKEAEEALAESERRYRLLGENASDVIWIADMNLNLTYMSPSAGRLLSCSIEEAMTLTIVDMLTPESLEWGAKALAEQMALEGGKGIDPHRQWTLEVQLRRRDGSTVWVEERMNFIRDAAGRPCGIMGIARDISERRKMEDALRESEQRYRLMAENITDVIWALDMNLNTVYVSPSVMQQKGYTVEEALKLPLDRQMSPEAMDEIMKTILEELALEESGTADPHRSRTAEGETYRKDGSRYWVEITASFLRDEQGKPVGLMGVTRDITERKKAEEALRQSEEKFKALVENSAAVVFSIDTLGNLDYISPAIERLSGFTAEDLVGKSAIQYVVAEDLPGLMASMEKTLSGQLEPYEFRVQHSNGSVHHILTSSRPICRNGEVTALIGVMVDVTGRKTAEEALRSSEANYRNLFDNTLVGLEVFDAETMKVVLANHSIARMFGFKSPEDMVGTEPLDYVLPEDLDWVVAELAEAMADPTNPRVVTIRARTEDGRIIWVTGMGMPFEYVRRPSILLSLVDVTAAKEAELRVAESEEKNRLLIENAAESIVVIQDGVLKFANSKCAEFVGYSQEELISRPFVDFVNPDDRQMLADYYVKRMSGEQVPDTYQARLVDKEGNVKSVQINAAALGWEGKPAVLAMVSDITERLKAEQALRDSEEKSRLLLDNAAEGIIVVQDGIVKYANPICTEMSGYTNEELMARSFLEIVHPEDRQMIAENHVKRISGEEAPNNYRFRVMDKAGRIRWLQINTVRFSWEEKPAVLSMLSDVTAQREAEEALRASEEKYRALYEDNPSMYFTVDPAGTVLSVNQFGCEQLGYTAEELLNESVLKVFHEEDKAAAARIVARCVEHLGEVFHWELRKVRKSGSVMWVKETARAAQVNDGEIVVFIVCEDISDRKQAEEALRASEERYRFLAENASDVIWVIASDLKFTYVSPSLTRLMGYGTDEIIGRSFNQLLTPDSLALMARAYLGDMAGEESRPGSLISRTVEIEAVCKDGSRVWLEAAINTIRDPEGRITGFQGACRDITERRKGDQALKESEERFRALIEGARDAIAVIDLNGRVTYNSPTSGRMVNGFLDNLVTTSVQDRVHPDDAERVANVFESLIKSPDGTVVDAELRYRRDDESWGFIEARGTNRVHDPKIGGIVVNYRDITGRRQAEEAFRESESRYRLLAENVSDVIWSLNLKSKRSFFSPSVTRLLGYTVEEAESMKMREVVSPSSYPKARMAFSEMTAKNGKNAADLSSSAQLDMELIRKDGSIVWVDVSVTLVRDSNGRPEEVFGVIRDVTQRKRAEEALRASEEYFRALIENAWDAIAIVDANGIMLYESPSSARILGYEPEEIVGTNLAEFVRREDIVQMTDLFRRFRNEPGAIVMVDAGFRHKDGHYIECEGTLQNFLHDPKISGIVANYRDVTDRHRAEEAIRTSEERFRNLVEATSDWVWEVDPTGIYTYVSPKVREVMGYEVGEIVGKSIFDLMPVRESSRFARIFQSHAAERRAFSFVESSRLHRDGRVVVMETSGVPFFSEDGTLLGYRGIGRDITNRKKVEKDLENSLKKVEKTMEAAIQAISYTMETRDPYTTGHQKRVTQLACAIAKEMGVTPWQIDGIRVAGLLHDIGKIAVPTEILSKPGKLSDIEFSMIKAHPKVGFDILKNVEFEWPIARIVVQHHERLDGSGYPAGIRGKDILQEARILAVADVVEAMSSHRPYRPALGLDKALAEVARGSGTLYDPEVVRACTVVINERGFKFQN